MELKTLIKQMCSLMSVSGYETFEREKLLALIGGYFDENHVDAVGNQVFVKRCGKENAARILIDAHMDEIGMYVSEILEDGFLRVVNIGGLDTRILQAARVCIYGKKTIYGVIASTPPHLQKRGDAEKLVPVKDLLIDTGYSKKESEEILRIGTPVGYEPVYTDLAGNCISGKGFDDKACGACAVYALAGLDAAELAGDVYLQLSVHEETDRVGGAAVSAYSVDPDYAMVIDVNLGRTPDTPSNETVLTGGGVSITLSPITDKKLTKMLAEAAEEKKIKYQYSVCASHTGTNTPDVALMREGIPTVDAGLPLTCMHTYTEVINTEDCEAVAALVKEFVCSEKIAKEFTNARI